MWMLCPDQPKESREWPNKILVIFMEEKYNNLDTGYRSEKSNLEELLRENIRYSQAILFDTQKIKRHMMWRTIFNVVWLILFLAPLIVAIFWLPQIMGDLIGQFQGLTGDGANTVDLLKQLQQLK